MLDLDARVSPAPGSDQAPGSVGSVIAVTGSQASVGLLEFRSPVSDDASVTVGKLLGVRRNGNILVGLVSDISIQTPSVAREQGYRAVAQLELMGEITRERAGEAGFKRGVTHYPVIGDDVALLNGRELRILYDVSGTNMIEIGRLQQDASIGAYVDIDEMLNKHFAVLGTTGVGKSSGLAHILRETSRVRPDLRMFLVDVHNEYSNCFGARAQIVNPRNLRLPFWLFNFEETVDVVFGGRPGVEDEVEILSEVLPLAKSLYVQYRGADQPKIRRSDVHSAGFTVDTPVPYRLVDLVALIDERLGKLENRHTRSTYSRLISRLETVSNNPRYAFIFENANVGGDTMAEILSSLFRVPSEGVPVTIMQLAGFPSEVVDAVVSVICRMAFDFGLWSDGAVPLLFVCEEAHRYASADRSVGFGPTRKAISRIAKEGRKYGVYLGLVTQRPAELDPTILSQCSTLFAMRMTNDRDQALLRSAVSDAASHLLSFIPSLGTREVFAFGQGVALPTRLRFSELPPEVLRKNQDVAAPAAGTARDHGRRFVAAVVDRWRDATMREKVQLDDPVPSSVTSVPVPADLRPPPAPPGQFANPDRFKILKKPLASEPMRNKPAANLWPQG